MSYIAAVHKIYDKKVSSLFLEVLHCSDTLPSPLPSFISDTQIPISFSCPQDMRYFFTMRGFPEAALLLCPGRREGEEALWILCIRGAYPQPIV